MTSYQLAETVHTASPVLQRSYDRQLDAREVRRSFANGARLKRRANEHRKSTAYRPTGHRDMGQRNARYCEADEPNISGSRGAWCVPVVLHGQWK